MVNAVLTVQTFEGRCSDYICIPSSLGRQVQEKSVPELLYLPGAMEKFSTWKEDSMLVGK